MLVQWGGVDYEYDPRMIDTKTAIKINEYTGLGLRSWERGVDDGNAKCLQALLYAIKVQAGERVTSIASLDFAVIEFYEMMLEASSRELVERLAAQADDEDEPAADPMVTA